MQTLGDAITSATRPLVTILLAAVLGWGFIIGRVSADQFVPIVGMVLAFWFGSRQSERQAETVADRAAAQVVAATVERRALPVQPPAERKG